MTDDTEANIYFLNRFKSNQSLFYLLHMIYERYLFLKFIGDKKEAKYAGLMAWRHIVIVMHIIFRQVLTIS